MAGAVHWIRPLRMMLVKIDFIVLIIINVV